MIESISAITLATHEMPRAVRFYRALGFEILHGRHGSNFTRRIDRRSDRKCESLIAVLLPVLQLHPERFPLGAC
jgi:catechol 2,3-dioxygenase-like lactoylglutathione lyase family enzyme